MERRSGEREQPYRPLEPVHACATIRPTRPRLPIAIASTDHIECPGTPRSLQQQGAGSHSAALAVRRTARPMGFSGSRWCPHPAVERSAERGGAPETSPGAREEDRGGGHQGEPRPQSEEEHPAVRAEALQVCIPTSPRFSLRTWTTPADYFTASSTMAGTATSSGGQKKATRLSCSTRRNLRRS